MQDLFSHLFRWHIQKIDLNHYYLCVPVAEFALESFGDSVRSCPMRMFFVRTVSKMTMRRSGSISSKSLRRRLVFQSGFSLSSFTWVGEFVIDRSTEDTAVARNIQNIKPMRAPSARRKRIIKRPAMQRHAQPFRGPLDVFPFPPVPALKPRVFAFRDVKVIENDWIVTELMLII
ncbi:hypothetical protein BT96DRAFT_983416 [Gymnopus androsaceus JB14]|uniref:Uncharacterized protein n=1 Tax=Gymnopus androsaceus JB14 TaxID=1447944 RepID=A0A6A4IPF0_9AGAR|nr:hypothetical protein BT96DRAFT_983416 [Gymnopus androsaceus JB14]